MSSSGWRNEERKRHKYRYERNEKAGVVYHREGIVGDYDDFNDVEELIDFIRTGNK